MYFVAFNVFIKIFKVHRPQNPTVEPCLWGPVVPHLLDSVISFQPFWAESFRKKYTNIFWVLLDHISLGFGPPHLGSIGPPLWVYKDSSSSTRRQPRMIPLFFLFLFALLIPKSCVKDVNHITMKYEHH